jgi:hypothetical protein
VAYANFGIVSSAVIAHTDVGELASSPDPGTGSVARRREGHDFVSATP